MNTKDWKNEFYELLGCIDPKKMRIEEAQCLKSSNMPRYLYKYRSFNDGYELENLKESTVWLNSPSEYNDPFECIEYFDPNRLWSAMGNQVLEHTIKAMEEECEIPETVKKQALLEEDGSKFIMNYIFKGNKTLINITEKVIGEMLVNLQETKSRKKLAMMQENMNVSSFSEDNYNILMWSHYGDCHKGFCIEYDLDILDYRTKRFFYPIFYQDSLFDATEHLKQSLKDDGDFNVLYGILACATKYTNWQYEKEWRIILNFGKEQSKKTFPLPCQSSVYMGLRISEKNREILLNICKQLNLNLFEAKQSIDKYEITFTQIYNATKIGIGKN